MDTGVVRDPEISPDGKRVIFSMRKNIKDGYHIYEIGLDGSNMRQLT
jgi:Tol biopolymer transport system component